MQQKATLHDPHPLPKPQRELVASSPPSVLAESFQKGSKVIVSYPNTKTSVLQDTISTPRVVKENVDSPVKKAEIDKSLVMKYLESATKAAVVVFNTGKIWLSVG
eukprot:gene2325-2471_t